MADILEDEGLRGRTGIFSDRADAGRKLAVFLEGHIPLNRPLVCAVPAGGVPVGLEVAAALHAPLMLGVVRKLKIPWNPEAGFGAMTWDGRVFLNQAMVQAAGITREEVRHAMEETRRSIDERMARYGGSGQAALPSGREVVVTDDGLASGYTMVAAVTTLRDAGPARVIVAVPTGSASAVALAARHSDVVVCLNIRGGPSFAVADAYQRWYDLSDREVEALLARARGLGLM